MLPIIITDWILGMDNYIDQRLKKIIRAQKEEIEEAVNLEVYAEINKRQLNEVSEWILPTGVRLSRKVNSRACYFECQDEMAKEDLLEFLEQKGVAWQEN